SIVGSLATGKFLRTSSWLPRSYPELKPGISEQYMVLHLPHLDSISGPDVRDIAKLLDDEFLSQVQCLRSFEGPRRQCLVQTDTIAVGIMRRPLDLNANRYTCC